MVGLSVFTLGAANIQQNNIAQRAATLAKTINFGNALEAPTEGAWGMTLEESYFTAVQKAGFSAIRLPTKWSAHTQTKSPYTIDPKFFARVDWAVKNAVSRGLAIIINIHHYDEILENPAAHKERLLAIWKQIAEHYKKESDKVFFEVLNEPNSKLEAVWNAYQNEAISVIRKSNPTRAIIVGGNGWNSIAGLEQIVLPNDPNLIGTFHFYSPFTFTHQGAEWINPVPPTGVQWNTTSTSWRSGWQNWSWKSTIRPIDAGFEVTYNEGYAGLYLHNDTPASNVKNILFSTNQVLPLTITCLEKNNGNNNNPKGFSFDSKVGLNTIPTTACGSSNGNIRDILIMNNSAEAKPTWQLKSMVLETANGTISLLSSGADELRGELERVAAWSKKTGRPVFMGEFGSYGKADNDSRIRWTNFVRSTAEQLGITWSYWEFGAGFGVYDRGSRSYKTDLTKALLPNFKP